MTARLKYFDDFVKTIDLDSYRQKYAHIKIVEMDLPRNVQALKTLYKYYWEKINLLKIPDFEEYYDCYLAEHNEDIEQFRIKTEMCRKCFAKGLRARIYRTWASLITQIHAGYVAESVFGKGSVKMNEILDHSGKDMEILYKNKSYGIQIKKESHRPEARIQRCNEKAIFTIKYCVPQARDFINPCYIRGEHCNEVKPQMLDFKKFSKNGFLERYDNGFVVFLPEIFKDLKKHFLIFDCVNYCLR